MDIKSIFIIIFALNSMKTPRFSKKNKALKKKYEDRNNSYQKIAHLFIFGDDRTNFLPKKCIGGSLTYYYNLNKVYLEVPTAGTILNKTLISKSFNDLFKIALEKCNNYLRSIKADKNQVKHFKSYLSILRKRR